MSSASTSSSLVELAREYVSYELEPSYRQQVQEWLDTNNEAELKTAFVPRIAFGTAGLRARMAAGYHNMGPLVIIQTTQGLVRYINAFHTNVPASELQSRGVVIGYDGRHNSRFYAKLAAAVFLSEGFKVHLFSREVCTPFVPFGVLKLNTIAGIMITASHNPKDDNGYKLYWSNGAQIIPPHDSGISDQIAANLKPWRTDYEALFETKQKENVITDPFEQINSTYFSEINQYCWNRDLNKNAVIKATYTAMHGVGAPFTAQSLATFSLPPYIPTPAQVAIDPEFSTVKFPNPEEGKGALKLAMEEADKHGSTLILANDPDADRLAIAVKEKPEDKEWRILNGNEIALLLADYVFTQYKAKHTKEEIANCVMLSSTVSSKAIQSMAQQEGFTYLDTLTGFKWMGNVASEQVAKGRTFLFAFEVEIGFLVGSTSFDKDGVRTAAIFYEMVNYWHVTHQISSLQRLQQLYQKYGYFHMNTSYFFCYDPAVAAKLFARLRNYENTNNYPTSVGPFKIASVRDVTLGKDNGEADGLSKLPKDPSSQMLTFRFENGAVCTLRNSGTEPKLKYYIEARATESAEKAKTLADEITHNIIQHFIEPEKNGLTAPQR